MRNPAHRPTPHPTRRRALKLSAAASGLAMFGCQTRPPATTVQTAIQGAPDLILTNADIVTLDPARPRARAVAVKNGFVQATGADADMLARRGRATRVLDAGGRQVIPGLNDSHQHPTRAGRFFAAEVRWDGVDSLARGLEMIREAASVTPPGQWVRVIGGWSPFQFAERRMPTPAELTRIAPDTPVYVLYLYSQGFLNAAAVRTRELTPATDAPAGTRYEFTPDGGAILHAEPNPDLLYASIGVLPPLPEDVQALSTRHYYRDLNRFGLTSVIDAGGGGHRYPDDYGGTAALAAAGAPEDGGLTLRVSKYLFPQNKGDELAEFQSWIDAYEVGVNRAQELAHGYELDGGGEFLVWSAGDYENFLAPRPGLADRPGWRAELMAVTRLLLRNGWPLRIHATYDQSAARILDVFAEADRLERAEGRAGLAGIRWAMDHGETYTPATLARIKAMGGGMAVQSRMAYAGEYFLQRYGREATRDAPPLQAMRAAGLPLGLGSDATRVASYNPWNTLYWATTGRSVGGTELHGPDQRLTREQALYHHTKGSAWFSQEESVKGSLAPGQYADLAVLSAPYTDVSDADIPRIESVLTLLAGAPVWGADDFADLMEPLPPIQPAWSPVRLFGGYQT